MSANSHINYESRFDQKQRQRTRTAALQHGYRNLIEAVNGRQADKYKQARIGLSLFDMMQDPFATTNLLSENSTTAEPHRQRFYPTQKT